MSGSRLPMIMASHGQRVNRDGREDLDALLARVHACQVCAASLPLGPRPVIQASVTARILIVGQAPGTRVHETGIPWNDRSGDRLRGWLGLDRDTFYDRHRIALMGMGFCYPGRLPNGGDAPPRPECAPLWHALLRAEMAGIELAILVGSYAHVYYLGARRMATMGETVRAWRDYLPEFIPTPHPSWRTTGWLNRNPWFGKELVPDLRRRVRAILG